MLISRSTPKPRSHRTPRGGKKIAKMILHISEQVRGIVLITCWSAEPYKFEKTKPELKPGGDSSFFIGRADLFAVRKRISHP